MARARARRGIRRADDILAKAMIKEMTKGRCIVWRSSMVVAIACAAQMAAAQAPQTQQDEYTEYALLAPETASFRIVYDVTATSSGATMYFNPIRKGSEASDEAVYDLATGQPLKFEQ